VVLNVLFAYLLSCAPCVGGEGVVEGGEEGEEVERRHCNCQFALLLLSTKLFHLFFFPFSP